MMLNDCDLNDDVFNVHGNVKKSRISFANVKILRYDHRT